jgi:Kiwa KwaB-like protein
MHFFALIVEPGHGLVPKRIRSRQALQTEMGRLFQEQQDSFLGGREGIDFDPRYNLEEDELFAVPHFTLPVEIQKCALHPNQCDDLHLDRSTRIKAIYAVNLTETGQLEIAFQSFAQRRLLVGGCTILQQQNTYQKMQDPGLTLDYKLAAYYDGVNLLFQNHAVVNRFLDLTDIFTEATDSDIAEVCQHEKLHVDGAEEIFETADSVMRKRFMVVKASGILDQVSPRKIQTQAKAYGLSLAIRAGRLVVPREKRVIKELLRLLMEG